VCDVTFVGDGPPVLRELEGDADAGGKWELFTWQPAAGYLAAGAVEKASRPA